MRAPIIGVVVLALVLSIPAAGLTGEVEVVGLWVKWTMRGVHLYDFEAEIQVRNDDDRDHLASGSVKFYNSQGRLVHSRAFSGRVEAGDRVTLVTRGTVSVRKREEIDYWEAIIY